MNAKFLRNGIVMLVLVAGTVALLYTWVQSSSPHPQLGYSDFYKDVKEGNVTKVVQDGESLTVLALRHLVQDLARCAFTRSIW